MLSTAVGASINQFDNDVCGIRVALSMYESITGRRVSAEDGLRALVERPASLPDGIAWKQLMRDVPKDPWGNDYRYIAGRDLPDGYGIYSCGPDGISHSQGNDADDRNTWSPDGRGSRPRLSDHVAACIYIGGAGLIIGFIFGSRPSRHREQPSNTTTEQPGPAQPATQPADKDPSKDQPSTPTSKVAPR